MSFDLISLILQAGLIVKLVLTVLLVPLALVLSPLERRGMPKDAIAPAAWRQITGAVLLCLGLALLAMFGFGGGPVPWLDQAAFAALVVGGLLAGVLQSLVKR